MMIPMNANVASQTMFVTTNTSEKLTTPRTKANTAPMSALVPICTPRGCQITKTNVPINKSVALITTHARTQLFFQADPMPNTQSPLSTPNENDPSVSESHNTPISLVVPPSQTLHLLKFLDAVKCVIGSY